MRRGEPPRMRSRAPESSLRRRSAPPVRLSILRVEFDTGDVPAIPQQCFRKLSEPYLGIAAAETFLDHHLFRIVRPALGIAARQKHLAGL